MDFVVAEADFWVYAELKKNKDEKNKMSHIMINIQHVTLNDATYLEKLCTAIGTIIGLPQKGHELMHCKRLSLQEGSSQLLYLK